MKKHKIIIMVIKVAIVLWAIYSIYCKLQEIVSKIKKPELPKFKIFPEKGFIKTVESIVYPARKAS